MFETIVGMSLKRARAILELEPDPNRPDYLKILNVQATVLANVMTAKVRVDDASLRKVHDDRMDRILKIVQQTEKRLEADAPTPPLN